MCDGECVAPFLKETRTMMTEGIFKMRNGQVDSEPRLQGLICQKKKLLITRFLVTSKARHIRDEKVTYCQLKILPVVHIHYNPPPSPDKNKMCINQTTMHRQKVTCEPLRI